VANLSIPPPSRVAIGTALVGGQRVDIYLNPEWARYFESLNTTVIVTSDAVGLPGADGTTGAAGSGVAFSESGGDTEFIPGPRGEQGPKGEPGPALFMFQEPESNDVFWPIKNS
jgi:hypothetical protein